MNPLDLHIPGTPVYRNPADKKTDREETALDKRILAGTVTDRDLQDYAREHSIPAKTPAELTQVKNHMYANFAPPARHLAGSGEK